MVPEASLPQASLSHPSPGQIEFFSYSQMGKDLEVARSRMLSGQLDDSIWPSVQSRRWLIQGKDLLESWMQGPLEFQASQVEMMLLHLPESLCT